MAKSRQIELRFPLAGVHRATTLQNQPPYTTPYALNVRPHGAGEGRARGGSRPGLRGRYRETDFQMGDGSSPVRLLAGVQANPFAGLQTFTDDFERSEIGSEWRGDASSATRMLTLADGLLYSTEASGTRRTLVWWNSPKYDASAGAVLVEAWIYIDTTDQASVNLSQGQFELYAQLGVSNPDMQSGPYLRGVVDIVSAILSDGDVELIVGGTIAMDGGTLSDSWSTTSAQRLTLSLDAIGNPFPIAFVVNHVAPGSHTGENKRATVSIANRTLIYKTAYDPDVSPVFYNVSDEYRGFGVGLSRLGGASGRLGYIESVRIATYSGHGDAADRVLVAGGGGSLYWRGEDDSAFAAVVDSDISDSHPISAAEHSGELFIADYADAPVRGVDGFIRAYRDTDPLSGQVYLTSASVPDWTSVVDADRDLVTISDVAGAAYTAGVYEIDSLANGGAHLVLKGLRSSSDEDYQTAEAACRFDIHRPPLVFNPQLDATDQPTLKSWLAESGGGNVPLGCPLICRYQNRIVLAGEPGHMWYMSRSGNPYDWNYYADSDDLARAVFGQTADAGTISGDMTALSPHHDDHLLFGYSSSLFLLRGDPATGGRIDTVSHTVGPIARDAWCYGPSGEFLFLSRDGLCRLAPTANAQVELVSRTRLPDELLGVDVTANKITLAWDGYSRGIHIWVCPYSGSAARTHWYFDYVFQGFWEVSVHAELEPFCVCEDPQLTDGSRLLWGCRDGRLRHFDEAVAVDTRGQDTANAFESRVVIGPFQLAKGFRDAMATGIKIITAEFSGLGSSTPLYWYYAGGGDPESALERSKTGYTSDSMPVTRVGQEYDGLLRARGQYGALTIRGASTDPLKWGLESAFITARPCGRARVDTQFD
jgi:hypothetical protein